MKREEAIWWVNHLFEIRKEEYFNKEMIEDAKEVEEAQHMAIEALSAKAEWIPCSERLPKAEDMYQPPGQRYLCQLEAYGMRKFCVLSRLKGAVSPFWDWYGIAIHDSEVIAWMLLPEPYREESENK